jgi:hypothetical protein
MRRVGQATVSESISSEQVAELIVNCGDRNRKERQERETTEQRHQAEANNR